MQKKCLNKNRKIRIISGKWKGRKISVFNHILVRPTTSYMRETLFNWLYSVVANSICLDCFAGTGSLGLESLSRGARQVTFIDRNCFCVKYLHQVFYSFQECNSEIIYDDFYHWVKIPHNKSYDIIFIDPPFYNDTAISKVIFLLEKFNYFKKESWIYIETSNRNCAVNIYKIVPNDWNLYRRRITRNVLYLLYLRKM